jgi:hypothetical protein
MAESLKPVQQPNPELSQLAEDLVDPAADWGEVSDRITKLIGVRTDVGPEHCGQIEVSVGSFTIVLLGDDPNRQAGSGQVLVVGDDDSVRIGEWFEVLANPIFYVTQSTRLSGGVWGDCFDDWSPPLHFDTTDWEGTYATSDGHENWELSVNGERLSVHLEEHIHWGTEPAHIPAQEWASFEGEFCGATVYSDDAGCLWGWVSEAATVFFGRPTTMEGKVGGYLGALLSYSATDGDYEINSVSAQSVEAAELLNLVEWLGGRDPNFNQAECVATCNGFDGTVEELREHVGDEDDDDEE